MSNDFAGWISEGEIGETEGSILSVQMSYHNELYQDMPQGKKHKMSSIIYLFGLPTILYSV